jgi:hypothetical protein
MCTHRLYFSSKRLYATLTSPHLVICIVWCLVNQHEERTVAVSSKLTCIKDAIHAKAAEYGVIVFPLIYHICPGANKLSMLYLAKHPWMD